MAPGVVTPEIGSACNHTPRRNTRIKPVQNVGRLQNSSDVNTVVESVFDPRRAAARAPRPIPRITMRMVAAPRSRIVLTMCCATMVLTGSRYV